jgi:hypothetical protein
MAAAAHRCRRRAAGNRALERRNFLLDVRGSQRESSAQTFGLDAIAPQALQHRIDQHLRSVLAQR